jgi:FixJ family two-component response regulator
MVMKSKGLVIAVVDDDPQLLDSVGDFLESAGHVVCPFSSGQAFLESNQLTHVDCLVTDITMPDLDGFELQKAVSAKRPGMPVIFITGKRDSDTLKRAAELSNGRFFQKPFDSQALVLAISEAILNSPKKK